MEKEKTIINCPECGTEINVNEALYEKLEEQIKTQYDKKSAKKENELHSQAKLLEDARKKFESEKNNQKEIIEKQVIAGIRSEKTKLTDLIRKEIEEEKSEELKEIKKTLHLKSEQVKELHKLKAKISNLEVEKEEMKSEIEAKAAEEFKNKLSEERERIKNSESERNRTELQKRDKLISDLSRELKDTQNKLIQGSNKLSGEVKEIELREFLKFNFPYDEITDVPSGINGADVIQTVKNNHGTTNGTILYERKQTQSFGKEWISKLKSDGRKIKADICVLVTKAMPSGNVESHFRDGVWVCTFDDVKIISALLRDGLLKQYSALESQKDKGTKMEMLYDYLRSIDFQNNIMAVLDAFKKMDKYLNKEREYAMKIFAERESHILQAKMSMLNLWGRIDGIAIDGLSREVKMLDS